MRFAHTLTIKVRSSACSTDDMVEELGGDGWEIATVEGKIVRTCVI